MDDAAALRSAMDQLGSRQRAVLVLRYYLDFSAAETAAYLSEGTVKSQAARGLANLRALLEKESVRSEEGA